MKVHHAMRAVRSATVLLAAGLLGAASSAGAASFVAYYDGPGGLGYSESTALAANAAGIPLVTAHPASAPDPDQELVTTQLLDDASVTTGNPATGTSSWTVEYLNPDPSSPIFLLLTDPRPHVSPLNGQPVEYADIDVGLTLTSGMGGLDWIILAFGVPNSDEMYYYPAVQLAPLPGGDTHGASFEVNYSLRNPLFFFEPNGFELGIPKLNLLAVNVPVPEPSTALLTALGLAALAGRRRRRS